MSERQVTRLIKILENSGELVVERSRGGKTHSYVVNMSIPAPDKLSPLGGGIAEPNPDNLSPLNPDKLSPSDDAPTLTNRVLNPDKSGNPPTPPYKDNRFKPSDKREEGTRLRSRPRSRPSDPRKEHPAIRAVREITGRFPDKILWDGFIAALGADPDEQKLRGCYLKWRERGHSPVNYAWLTEWYFTGIPARPLPGNGAFNGIHAPPRDADCAECNNDRRVRGTLETWPCEHCRPIEYKAWLKSRGKL